MLPDNFEQKTNYTNPNIFYLFNRLIYEYDIQAANVNLCIYYKILPKKITDKILAMPKKKRNVTIGIKERDKEFKEKMKKAFIDIRKEFYDANDVDILDLVSVKKDALFLASDCKNTKFGNVNFVVKNIYSSYIRLGSLEIYYSTYKIDVKGIDDEVLVLHEDGILKLLRAFFRKMETGSIQETLSFLNRVSTDYKNRKLPLEYYREFNDKSKYIVLSSTDIYDDYWDDRIDEIDITYNFTNVIIPLVKIAL